ncbi:MAG: molecular chaperone TorD family protein [Candidatus Rokubacteria bacterium]|nr:molecular chaperone TorD family protein [Candidatus Rokubacteria bacterium]
MSGARAWATARGQLYRYLATVFLTPPGAGLVAPLLDAEVLSELGRRFGEEAVAELRSFRDGFLGGYESLDQEYQGLFVVPLGRYVTPYEAVYRDEHVVGDQVVRGLLLGPSTVAIKALYREAGVEVVEEVCELPDHVGLELGYLGTLCEAEAQAAERGDADGVARARGLQRRLLHDHLLAWVPSLCGRLRDLAPGPFYRGIAALTEAALRHEAEALARPGVLEGGAVSPSTARSETG